jgi:nickel-type superoxide dismutase maturation protease
MPRFPFSRFKVEGESMMPSLFPGDEVLVCSWLKGRVGDTIVFKKEAKTMIKRIARITGNSIHVKGENPQKSTDSCEFGGILKGQIIGRVIWLMT